MSSQSLGQSLNSQTSNDNLDASLSVSVQQSTATLTEDLAENDTEGLALRLNGILMKAKETSDVIAERLIKIKAAENPLLQAAEPLLLTLCQLPDLVLKDDLQITVFHALLVREIDVFHQLCTQADLPHEDVVAASFALCTALDEAASLTVWGGAPAVASAPVVAIEQINAAVGIWSAQMLAALFHKDTTGGTKVFLLIGRLMTNKSQGYIDLLEVLYRIISIGFEGQYRSIPDGLRQHEEIRQLMYTEISQARPPVPLALSPQWQGEGAATFKLLHRVPVWVTASVLGLAVFGQFVWYKYQLLQQSEAVVSQIAAIGKPAVATALRLKGVLQEEIAQGKVIVIEDAQRSRVLVKGDEIRMPEQNTVHSAPQPLLHKLALEIAGMPGVMVQVSAQSDMLSQARAVADVLQAGGVAAARLRVRADDTPINDHVNVVEDAQDWRVVIDIQAVARSSDTKSLLQKYGESDRSDREVSSAVGAA